MSPAGGLFRNTAKTAVLLAGLGGLMVGIGSLFGRGGAVIGFGLGVLMVGFSYWKSDTLAIKAARAVPADPVRFSAYHETVRELTERAGMPMPKLYISPEQQPNAFATGRNPQHAAVAITEGLLQVCSVEEIRGVLAHELAHIKNRDILVSTVAAILASAITTVANVLSFGALLGGTHEGDEDEGGSFLGSLAMILVAPLAATLIQLAISRSRELLADETGARIARDPEGLASALVRLDHLSRHVLPAHASPAAASLFIVNPFGALDTVARWFSTHPSTEERVMRLRALAWGDRPPASLRYA